VLTAYSDPASALTAATADQPQLQQQQLRELVFPLMQIILGVLRLAPSARHCPLALHCLTLLQRLAAAARVFVPCASACLDLLESPALLGTPTWR
jgi:nucleolar complex protein 2